MSNLLFGVTYSDIPQDYKDNVNRGYYNSKEEALREYKNDLYFSEMCAREQRENLEDMQRP